MTPTVPTSVEELQPGDLWDPRSFEEWAARERLRTFLPAWTAQAGQERKLRGMCAWMIFALAVLQTLGGFGLLVAIGVGVLEIDVGLLQVVYPALLAEIFGLFLVVVRFLFSHPLKYNFDALKEGA